ncbi:MULTISPECIES: helix-turn-helix domain-containing protein [Paenibacillus]|uniref:helix-turn-helix domain-containing protein n=1 Tax=Paenibacillus TaxID=44249 RepID=UPI002116D591|nr:helix-turn-helix transcriptional regulator [Paenibacillus lautus]
MEKEKLSISSFAIKSGINSGTLSRFINGNQPLSVSSLDLITKAMNLEEGYFYSLYVNESTPNWRRLGPFIMRCAELGKLYCIDQAVDLIIDSPAYSSLLFDSAEALFHKGNREAALIIYKKVAESEKHQHAERLGLCQYRIFTCSLNSDQEHNLNCTIQFETYIKRLPEGVQLDAVKDLTDTLLSLRKRNRAKHYAQEMGRISRMLYAQKHNKKRPHRKPIEPAKTLFGYILYSDLLLGSIAADNDDYDQALYYLSCYEDQTWIVESDESSERTKEQFREWARGNRYLYELMKGNIEVLEPYIEYISSRENEILRALFKIIQAANMYHFEIDEYLERFEHQIRDHLKRREPVGSYNEQLIDDRFAKFLTDVGMYYIRKGNIQKGSKYILDSLEFSYTINFEINIVRCCTTIEHIQSKLNHDDLERYAEIRDKLKVSGTLIHP